MTDNRHHRIRHIPLIDIKLRTGEKRSHRTAQQHRTYYSINHQECTVCILSQQISRLALELIADSLQHKTEQNNHPKPVRTTKTRAIKQWERCKERTTKRYQRSERKLPLPTGRVNHHFPVLFRLAQAENKRITTLHKQQEYKKGSQQ